MSSYEAGKEQINQWVRQNIKEGSTCLDVGACDGRWWRMLGDFLKMDACEIFAPNVEKYRLYEKYRHVYQFDIYDLSYRHYDVVIFGDVIEHMSIERAQEVLKYAEGHADHIIVAVPFRFRQAAIYGNPWEEHIQDDLTPNSFNLLYPGYTPLWINEKYAYYYKRGTDK